MWVYPIDLVYVFYLDCLESHAEERYFDLHGRRLASYSSREVDKKGHKQIEKMWDDTMKPFHKALKKASTRAPDKKLNTSNDAATKLYGLATVQPVKQRKK